MNLCQGTSVREKTYKGLILYLKNEENPVFMINYRKEVKYAWKDKKWDRVSGTSRSGREGQHHFYKKLEVTRFQLYCKCGRRGPLILAIPSRAFSLVLLSPKHSQGERDRKSPPLPFNVHSPISLRCLLSLSNFSSKANLVSCYWTLALLLVSCQLKMPRNEPHTLTLHTLSLWPLATAIYTFYTSHLASFTCSLDSGTDIYATNRNYDNT